MSRSRFARFDLPRSILATAGVLLFVRILAPQWRAGFELSFPDSFSYVDAAKPGPLNGQFWFGQRPPGLSLLLWFFDASPRIFVLVQTLMYCTSFVLLADRVLARARNRWIGWSLAGITMLIAAQSRFAFWNVEVLSESLSVSVWILALLAWWRVADGEPRFVAATSLTIAWILVRDANVVPVAVLASTLLVLAWVRRNLPEGRLLMRSGVVLLLAVSYSMVSQNVSERNQYGLMNNVGLRVLPDPRMTDKFVSMGMPMSEALERQTGQSAWAADGMMYSPDLAEFRDWVHGRGQVTFVRSVFSEPSFWWDRFRDSVGGTWKYPFAEYDRLGVSPRLLTSSSVLLGARSNLQALAVLVSVVTAVALMFRGGKKRQGVLTGVLAVTVFTELFTCSVADAFEVQRHLVGGILRTALLPVVAAAVFFGVEAARDSASLHGSSRGWTRPTLVGVGAAMTGAAIMVLEFRTQDWDPAFARTVVERVGRFGGTFYENGIWHHGPLDAVLYDLARRMTDFDAYWFVIAIFVICISVIVAMSAAAVARSAGAPLWMLPAMIAAVILHFSISSSDYAGVIYSRNVSTALLAAGFAAVASDKPWRSHSRSSLWFCGVAVAGGLAVQTMLSSIFAALALVVFLVRTRGSGVGLRRPWTTALCTIGAAVASAPAWYFLRGAFNEFWQNWWVMGGYMNSATGLSLVEQLEKGRSVIADYYGDRPLLLAGVAVCAVAGFVRVVGDSDRARMIRRFSLFWLLAGWLELVVSQRYSSHYFVVIAVPTTMLLASSLPLVASRTIGQGVPDGATSDTSRRRSPMPAVLVVSGLIVTTQCMDLTRSGLESLGRFRGFGAHADFVRDTRSGASKNVRAIIDLVSRDRDPLLAWTMFPWTYLEFERVPATRLSWKSFMLGEIYLARSSPEYVLKDTWEWFEEDMKEADPAVYIRPVEIPMVEGTPFMRRLESDFTPVYGDSVFELSFRKDVADTVLGGRESAGREEVDPSGSVRIGGKCSSYSSRLLESTGDPTLGVVLTSVSDPGRSWYMRAEAGVASSGFGTAEIFQRPITWSIGSTVRVVVGDRSAALVVDGRIVSAVSFDQPVEATVNWNTGSTAIARGELVRAVLPNGC